MCRILAISSAGGIPTEFARSFRSLAETGNTIYGTYEETKSQGRPTGHRGGWGLAASRDGQWLGSPRISQVDQDESLGDASNPHSGYLETLEAFNILGPGVLIAHLRRPSEGDVCNLNTHPFSRNGYVFAHNGAVPWLTEEDGEAKAPSQRNDSRVLFQRILAAMAEGDSVENAVESVVSTIHRDGRNKTRPYSSLTSVLSDGKTLWVIRNVNPNKGSAAKRYYTMHLGKIADTPKVVVACQEVLSYGSAAMEWKPMKECELAVIRDGAIVETRPLAQ